MKTLYEDIAFVVYPVSDMERSRRFYEDTLELTVTESFDGAWIEFDIGNGTLAITNTFPHLIPGSKGAIIAIEVKSIQAFGVALKNKNVDWHTGPFDTPACLGGSVLDPDGNEVIFHQRKRKIG
ncbi:MAG: VOC family protein [Verrucomicrobiota bacterium]|nr:VOC family protein [Verrucomicrobiota bacterium]